MTAREIPMFDGCQRWRLGRESYRPKGEPIDVRRFGVEPLEEAEAKQFVVAHHYSRSYPAARLRVGLHRTRPGGGTELVGVGVFSVPASQAVIPKWCPTVACAAGVELGRFVLLDDVAANGESWFLSRAFEVLRRELPEVRAVLSFSDPLPRTSLVTGSTVMPGHVGTIYQALNGRYVGRANPNTVYLSRSGLVVSARLLSKLRGETRGFEYSARTFVELGAPPRQLFESGGAWVTRALAEGPFRRVRHPGNHAYTWALGDRRAAREITRHAHPARPYPKRIEVSP